MSLNRREMLVQSLALPFVPSFKAGGESQIVTGSSHLSRESAGAYRQILQECFHACRSHLVIFTGVAEPWQMAWAQLHSHLCAGAWVIWEDLPASAALSHSHDDLYVRYSWPFTSLIRRMGHTHDLSCEPDEQIAHSGGTPIAFRRCAGRGAWIHLGSMLGPQVKAGDRDAIALAKSLISQAT